MVTAVQFNVALLFAIVLWRIQFCHYKENI
jgi:hypothetical protein